MKKLLIFCSFMLLLWAALFLLMGQINNGGGGGSTFTGGTITTPILGANGTCSAATYGFTTNSGYGEIFLSGVGAAMAAGGNCTAGFSSTSVVMGSAISLEWTNGAPLTNANDTGMDRPTGGLLQENAGTPGTEGGLLRPGFDSCRVTADITLPVNTATTVCSWSLPALAKAWAWQCEIPWVISAGTGTNTLAIIANASQTPTAATNGFAEILTTNTGTATEATTAISASGATTLLTSGTITPAATVFSARTSGTVLASGTAGTFAIQMTAAGTTATAAAKAGATCLLY
ncbi:MAG TPA: hypothetical protein VMQ17_08815 [Candidatus Sulfotelmatobacter sp.]|nr:hypothetical protein [Candidatus Sulfotelmatobacter sp.]